MQVYSCPYIAALVILIYGFLNIPLQPPICRTESENKNLIKICPFLFFLSKQEEQNRLKANSSWEHLKEELHVLISVEDTEERANLKLARAAEEIKKLLVPTVRPLPFSNLPLCSTGNNISAESYAKQNQENC